MTQEIFFSWDSFPELDLDTDIFNPLKGRRLILPGQYTKPSITAGNFEVSKVSVEASKGICVQFNPVKLSDVLEAIKILVFNSNWFAIANPIP